mmetsp:Transcript_23898/g.34220  ORF Transcript_23898/g.34220 Transcript_23898/m.34220 type:complete len:110 (+) Transcript_23898:169-498(+)
MTDCPQLMTVTSLSSLLNINLQVEPFASILECLQAATSPCFTALSLEKAIELMEAVCIYRFRSGKYSTKFIAEEFPDPHGFTGVELSHSETMNLVAAAAAIHQVTGPTE